MKIMVIDDSKTMLLTVVKCLEALGHTTVSSTDPLNTLDLYQRENPDLIILDVIMEKCSGYDIAKKIRSLRQKEWIPIIFLSGDISDEAIAEGIEAGGDDYLTKPFSDITLKAKINAMERIAKMRLELLRMNKRLEELSTIDVLTGIANRLYFEKTIRKNIAYAKRHSKKFALLYIDLDNFKNTNDTLGHQAGDILLKNAVDRMLSILREEDFIARLGGDEFAIILSEIDSFDSATYIAKRLIKLFQDPFIIEDTKVFSSASVGVALFPDSADTTEAIIKNVDMAMYKAKVLGKNNFYCYNESLSQYQSQLNQLEAELRYAITNQELHMEYQPKYNLLTKKIVGVESLIRWESPILGSVQPDIFIPLAEKTGIIHTIGKWVIETCCQQYFSWLDDYPAGIKMAINLSPLQLTKGDLANYIQETLTLYDISPHNIEFEITETAIMSGDETSEKLLQSLHKLGIALTIDDFGTGFSSLIHIKRLPINTLKIDKTFVMDIPKDENDIAIVKSVISLSKSLNLNVIAEGIETQEQLDFLVAQGCHFGQGYFLSKPLTASELIQLLKSEDDNK